MTGDCHVRFYESRRVRLPPATHLKGGRWRSGQQSTTSEKPAGQRPVLDRHTDQPAAYLTRQRTPLQQNHVAKPWGQATNPTKQS